MSIEKIARDELRDTIARTVFVEIWNDQPNAYGPAFEHDRDLWERIADALLPLLDNDFQAGAEAMREMAAKAVETIPYEHWEHWEPILAEHAEAIRSLPLPIQTAEGWQPIETAPKDGTLILGYQATPGDHYDKMSVCWCYRPSDHAIWIGAGGLMPTHWMPLPLPPLPQKEG